MYELKISSMKVDVIVLIKALAICLVVANHAGLSKGLHGGLNVLLVVSGVAMATFGFQGATPQTLQAFKRFAFRIGVPSFLIALVWGIAVSNVSLPELTFISNWFYKRRVVLFPIWYVQVIVQLMIVFFCIVLGFRFDA